MKITIVSVLVTVLMGFSQAALAQAVEMAAKCDDARNKLAELIKKPDITEAQKIKEALGLDIFASCDKVEGKIICYQCLDKDQNLRTLQLLQKRDTKKFELLGFGCRCRDDK